MEVTCGDARPDVREEPSPHGVIDLARLPSPFLGRSPAVLFIDRPQQLGPLRRDWIGEMLRHTEGLELDRSAGWPGKQLMERNIKTIVRSLFFLLLQHSRISEASEDWLWRKHLRARGKAAAVDADLGFFDCEGVTYKFAPSSSSHVVYLSPVYACGGIPRRTSMKNVFCTRQKLCCIRLLRSFGPSLPRIFRRKRKHAGQGGKPCKKHNCELRAQPSEGRRCRAYRLSRIDADASRRLRFFCETFACPCEIGFGTTLDCFLTSEQGANNF